MPRKNKPAAPEPQAQLSYFGSSFFGRNFSPLGRPLPNKSQIAVATFGGVMGGHVDDSRVFVIRASKTKHGARSSGKRWYAQHAILALYPLALPNPKHVNHLKLCRDINKHLNKNPDYRFGELKPMTVRRALQALHDANG